MTSVIKNGETMKTINSVKISASSRVGGRSENQDDFLIDTEKISDQSREFCYKGTSELTKQQIYIVCDGMGGEQYGQDASRKAVEYFEGLLREAKRPLTPMDIAGEIRRLNQEIVDYYRCRQARGGTTIALVMLNPDGTIEAFNIGDSPIFLVRSGEITMLSEEQSMAGIKLKKGTISREEYRESRERNLLLGYLGDDSGVSVDHLFYSRNKYQAGDKLLLSSDGLLDKIEPEEILGLLQQDCGADVLTEEAVKKGAGDNVTAVLLEIQ